MDINLSFLHFERHSHSVRWFTSFSVFVISLKNYVPLKLATLPFLIIIGESPRDPETFPIFFKPIAAPPPFGLTSRWKQILPLIRNIISSPSHFHRFNVIDIPFDRTIESYLSRQCVI
ncbi:MAG: hypothetical protein ACTS5R_01660 [Candidatus Hodgkinia cicadicola]